MCCSSSFYNGEFMKKMSGFTLIELMIVVAIIAILATIGYPAYKREVTRTSRADAHSALLRMADMQERFYLQNNTYTANIADLGGATSNEGYYDLAVSNVTNSTYTLTATPAPGSKQNADAECIAGIVLTHAGVKTPQECW